MRYKRTDVTQSETHLIMSHSICLIHALCKHNFRCLKTGFVFKFLFRSSFKTVALWVCCVGYSNRLSSVWMKSSELLSTQSA